MEILFELGINLVETFLIVEFLTRFLGAKYESPKCNIFFLMGWFVIFTELCIRNFITVFETFSAYIPIVLYVTYGILCLKGSFFAKVWASVLIHVILAVIAIMTNLIVCNIIGYDPNAMITVFNGIRIISVIITKIILFYVSRIILKIKHNQKLEYTTWAMLIVIPVISIISLCFLMKAAFEYEEVKGYVLIGMIGIVVANIVTYYFFYISDKHHENKLKISLLEQQNENALKNIEDSQSYINQMRIVKHDIKNQLMTIYNYINSGNTEQALDYIKSITDDHLPVIRKLVTTKNEAFNAVINSKTAICDSKKIFVELKVDDVIEKIDAVDTVILVGNLFDNAIEAAELTDAKRICLEIKKVNDYLSLLINNSISESILDSNVELMSTKTDKTLHGIGLKSVKSIVKKYNGMIDFYEKENEFFCHVILVPNKNI
ncbi:MAG: GHKL domain-containing protein [Clostridia bacterium]|nr:GHKL domain-containing protein [Clostridia bacterium]